MALSVACPCGASFEVGVVTAKSDVSTCIGKIVRATRELDTVLMARPRARRSTCCRGPKCGRS